MSTVVIKLMPASAWRKLVHTSDILPAVELIKNEYTVCKPFQSDKSGESAAEDAFDLTNNPDRYDEMRHLYEYHRSISVGDIVDVDGIEYVCDHRGWSVIS